MGRGGYAGISYKACRSAEKLAKACLLEETPGNISESWDRSIIKPTDRFGCRRLELFVRGFVYSRDHIDEVSSSKVSCVYKLGFCRFNFWGSLSDIESNRSSKLLTTAQANYRDCYRLRKNSCVNSIYRDI
jgi:hypothetical protein